MLTFTPSRPGFTQSISFPLATFATRPTTLTACARILDQLLLAKLSVASLHSHRLPATFKTLFALLLVNLFAVSAQLLELTVCAGILDSTLPAKLSVASLQPHELPVTAEKISHFQLFAVSSFPH